MTVWRLQGPQGIIGETGADGDDGEQGDKGAPGYSGLPGLPGPEVGLKGKMVAGGMEDFEGTRKGGWVGRWVGGWCPCEALRTYYQKCVLQVFFAGAVCGWMLGWMVSCGLNRRVESCVEKNARNTRWVEWMGWYGCKWHGWIRLNVNGGWVNDVCLGYWIGDWMVWRTDRRVGWVVG